MVVDTGAAGSERASHGKLPVDPRIFAVFLDGIQYVAAFNADRADGRVPADAVACRLAKISQVDGITGCIHVAGIIENHADDADVLEQWIGEFNIELDERFAAFEFMIPLMARAAEETTAS